VRYQAHLAPSHDKMLEGPLRGKWSGRHPRYVDIGSHLESGSTKACSHVETAIDLFKNKQHCTINRVLITHSGFVQKVLVAPAAMAERM
jgi:hypothetical protein